MPAVLEQAVQSETLLPQNHNINLQAYENIARGLIMAQNGGNGILKFHCRRFYRDIRRYPALPFVTDRKKQRNKPLFFSPIFDCTKIK